MRSASTTWLERLLPRGKGDLLWQIALFCGAYVLYRLVRGMVDGQQALAFAHARELVAIERELGVFFEPALHAWASEHMSVMAVASWVYVNSHFTVTAGGLAFLYLRRNQAFYFVRNMFMVAMGVALIGYLVYPTAPPRLTPGLGFSDPVAVFTGLTRSASSLQVLFNPFAAVPSMHVAFSLMLAGAMLHVVRRRWALVLWAAYPAVVTFSVLVTANHWWLDAVLGALTAGLATLTAAVAPGGARPRDLVWKAPAVVSATAPSGRAA